MRRSQRLSPCGAPGLRAVWRAVAWHAAWAQSAMRRRGSQTCVLLAAAACSGGDAPSATGTPSGEREQRAAAAVEQQAELQAEPAAAQTQAEPAQQAVEQTAQQTAPVEQAEDAVEAVQAQFEDESEQTITFDEQAVERAVAALAAHRAGLEVTRNVLGDPAAPVLIVEYGDFQ